MIYGLYLRNDCQGLRFYSLTKAEQKCVGIHSFSDFNDICKPIKLMIYVNQFKRIYFIPSPQDAEYAYFNFPELLPLRTALILHLQHNTTIDVRTKFSGCLSQEWEAFLADSYPYYLIVADEGLNHLQTYLFNFLITQSWAMKVNVVLSSGQTSDILRLYAYLMPSMHKNQKFFKEVTDT